MNLDELTKKSPFNKPVFISIDKDDENNVSNKTILIASFILSVFLKDSQTLIKDHYDKYGPLSMCKEDDVSDFIKEYYIPYICSFIKVLTDSNVKGFSLSEENADKVINCVKKVIKQVKNGKYMHKELANEGDENEDLLNSVHCMIGISIVSENETSEDKFFDIVENTAIIKEEFFVNIIAHEFIINLDENGNKVKTYSKIEL